MCGLCLRINADVERKLAEPRIVRPKRPRGRPARLFMENGKQYFQISISYYRSQEELNVRTTQRGFMDDVGEV